MAYTTIDKPSDHFQPVIWTGNATDDRAINIGMRPDLVWWKHRTSASYWHYLVDSSRGIGNQVYANGGDAEGTHSGGHVKSYTSTGITIDDDQAINHNSTTYVAWMWKANGGTTTSNGASGDIKASVTQADTTSKFSICTYTGTGINAGQSHRVNHGLGTTPHVMMFKSRGATGDWVIYHHKNTAAPETDYLVLNTDAATVDSANKFNDTGPTSTLATIGGDDNISSGTMVLYSFAEVKGYSKFGSYVSNNNADGPYVYTGFKPSFVMTKINDGGGTNWRIYDSKRQGFNGDNDFLMPNQAAVENTDASEMDLLSTGFKLVQAEGDANFNTSSVIYMAFAEHPFVSSEGIPTTAR